MTERRPRAVFMGSPELAVPALEVAHARCELSLVVTQPDRRAGRGRRLRPPPVKQAAERLGVPVWQPETLHGAQRDARLHGHDLFIVLAYGELLCQAVLDLPRACVNLHASLLPRWRGASPLQAAIRAGDRETGISVMRMVRALDAGPVYLQRAIAIDDTTTLPDLHDSLAVLAGEALGDFLADWKQREPVPQDESAVTWCGKLNADSGRLDWQMPAVELERLVRAYHPQPGCWCVAAGERLRVHAVRLAPLGVGEGLSPGTTLCHGREPAVVTGDGALVLERVQPAGARAMDGVAWLNGHPLPARLD